MKTGKELELNLLVKEAHIQQLKLKNQELLSDNVNIAELNIKLLNRINEVIEDLERTLEVNKHYKDKYNEWVNVDVDHIKYLLEKLKGEYNV